MKTKYEDFENWKQEILHRFFIKASTFDPLGLFRLNGVQIFLFKIYNMTSNKLILRNNNLFGIIYNNSIRNRIYMIFLRI